VAYNITALKSIIIINLKNITHFFLLLYMNWEKKKFKEQ